jgi:hypothetical protein
VYGAAYNQAKEHADVYVQSDQRQHHLAQEELVKPAISAFGGDRADYPFTQVLKCVPHHIASRRPDGTRP